MAGLRPFQNRLERFKISFIDLNSAAELIRKRTGSTRFSFGCLLKGLIACLIVAILIWLIIPGQQASSFRATSIAACAGHSVILHQEGSVWGWLNNNLNIGSNPQFAFGRPAQTDRGTNWATVATGWQTVAGIKHDGSLWVWGNGTQGLWGDKALQITMTPTQVGTDSDWGSVAAGNDFFAALKRDGTLWTWGGNRYGQVGDGTGAGKDYEQAGKKAPVQIGANTNWVMLRARVFRATALKSDGSLWAWGWNVYGELGDGSYEPRNAPVRVGKENDWAAVFVGNNHTLAIKRDGGLWTWGENVEGQLGDGTKIKKSYPIPVGKDHDWLMAAGGGYHTLALKKDGSLWAWGLNTSGQLGDGTRLSRLTPVRIGWSKDWVTIAAGENHSVALKRNGGVYVWGDVTPPRERAVVMWLRRNFPRIGVSLPPRRQGVLKPMKVIEVMTDRPPAKGVVPAR
jgi:alpha-tubulin suppressor-like RCC1 family protein